jgi:hypothetical protein
MLTLLTVLLLAAPDVSNTYRVEAPKVIKVKKGAAAHARIEVVPRSDAHVSPDAPISLSMSAGPSVKLEKQKLGRPDAQETKEKGVAFEVPFTADGKDEIKGSLSFFICTEKLCERQKREVAVRVDAE